MPHLSFETSDVRTKHNPGLVQLLHCIQRPRSARECLGFDRNRDTFDDSNGPIDIICASDATEAEGKEGLESVVRFFGFVDPRRQPAYDVATDGIAAGGISGDDEPPVEGLVDGNVTSFSGAAPESDVDSSALHRPQEMPEGWEGARVR